MARMTMDEAAEKLGVSVRTIGRRCESGALQSDIEIVDGKKRRMVEVPDDEQQIVNPENVIVVPDPTYGTCDTTPPAEIGDGLNEEGYAPGPVKGDDRLDRDQEPAAEASDEPADEPKQRMRGRKGETVRSMVWLGGHGLAFEFHKLANGRCVVPRAVKDIATNDQGETVGTVSFRKHTIYVQRLTETNEHGADWVATGEQAE